MANLLQKAADAFAVLRGASTVVKAPGEFGMTTSPQLSYGASRGTAELIAAYNETPWLRAAVGKVASKYAAVKWRVYRENDDGTRDELYGHPLAKLVQDGCPQLSSSQFRRVIQANIDLVGEVFLVKDRPSPNAAPVALWPIPASWVQELPKADSPFYKIRMGDVEQRIPAADVIWRRDPDIGNPYGRGRGVATSLVDEIAADEYAAKFVGSKFRNHNAPEGIITIKGVGQPSREQLQRLEDKFNARHRGPYRNGQTAVTTAEVKFTDMSRDLNLEEMTEFRKYLRNTVIQVFGVPPEMLGIIENSNRSTIDAARDIMAGEVLTPRLDMERADLQKWLVPEFDPDGRLGLIIDYDDPMPVSPEVKAGLMKAMPYAFKANEIRELAGLEQLEVYEIGVLMPGFEMVPIEDLPTVIGEREPQPPGGQSPGPAAVAPPADAVDPLEAAFAAAITKGVRTKANELDMTIDEILSALTPEPLAAPMTATAASAATQWAIYGFEEVGVAADLASTNQLLVEHLRRYGGDKIVGKITDTTKAKLRETLVDGLRAGEDVTRLTKRVQDVFVEFPKWRAKMIARTESLVTASAAREAAFDASGIVKFKEWLANTPFGQYRKDHLAYSGTRVPFNESFKISGATAKFPGGFNDPSHDINCRCTFLPVVPPPDVPLRSIDHNSVENKAPVNLITATPQLREGYLKAFEARLATTEKQFADAVESGAAVQQEAVIARLNEVMK